MANLTIACSFPSFRDALVNPTGFTYKEGTSINGSVIALPTKDAAGNVTAPAFMVVSYMALPDEKQITKLINNQSVISEAWRLLTSAQKDSTGKGFKDFAKAFGGWFLPYEAAAPEGYTFVSVAVRDRGALVASRGAKAGKIVAPAVKKGDLMRNAQGQLSTRKVVEALLPLSYKYLQLGNKLECGMYDISAATPLVGLDFPGMCRMHALKQFGGTTGYFRLIKESEVDLLNKVTPTGSSVDNAPKPGADPMEGFGGSDPTEPEPNFDLF